MRKHPQIHVAEEANKSVELHFMLLSDPNNNLFLTQRKSQDLRAGGAACSLVRADE